MLEGVRVLVNGLLVQDGVDRNGGLAHLAIANDQFALAAADGHQGVAALQAGGHGLVHGLTRQDAWRLQFDTAGLLGVQGTWA